VAAAGKAIDLDNHCVARLPFDFGLRTRTRRAARPTRTGLETRLLVGRPAREVDLVRRLAAERLVRAMFVVPIPGHHLDGERAQPGWTTFRIPRISQLML